jgi:ABC-type branched-subunit amino acid transport system substrate-binding protein
VAPRRRAFALTGAACVAAALALAGCGSAGTTSKGSYTISGHTLTIYLSAPSNWRSDPVARDLIRSEQLAFSQESSEVGDFKLGERVLALPRPSDNARAAIEDRTAIAYLGELAPGASDGTVGITNAVGLAQLSPTDTAYELGATSPAVAGSPKHYFEQYSTYGHTFARVVPTTAQEAAFLVEQMRAMGLHSVHVADDGSDYGATIADLVKAYAQHAGLSLSASQSGAAAIFYGAQSPAAGLRFFDAAAGAAPNAKLFGSSALDAGAFLGSVGASTAGRLYISTPAIPADRLNAAARAYRAAFTKRYGAAPSTQAIFGYAAMSALLGVLAHAGKNANSRANVVKGLLGLRNQPSVLGPLSLDNVGNAGLDSFVLNRVSGGALVAAKLAS